MGNLNKKFQILCTKALAATSPWLLGDNLSERVKNTSQNDKLVQPRMTIMQAAGRRQRYMPYGCMGSYGYGRGHGRGARGAFLGKFSEGDCHKITLNDSTLNADEVVYDNVNNDNVMVDKRELEAYVSCSMSVDRPEEGRGQQGPT